MKNNILRGKILEFLDHLYPDGADGQTIISVFYQYHDYNAIIDALNYIVDKGYVSKKEIPHLYKKLKTECIYKATPSGIDLMDGTTNDPAVTIPPQGA